LKDNYTYKELKILELMTNEAESGSNRFFYGALTSVILMGIISMFNVKYAVDKTKSVIESKIEKIINDSTIADTTKYKEMTNYFDLINYKK